MAVVVATAAAVADKTHWLECSVCSAGGLNS